MLFFIKELKYIGHVISEDGIKTNLNKIKAIVSMPLLTYEHQIVSFVGKTPNINLLYGMKIQRNLLNH